MLRRSECPRPILTFSREVAPHGHLCLLMDRRKFLGVLGTTAAVRFADAAEITSPFRDDIYPELVKSADRWVENELPKQQANGGWLDPHGILTVGGSASAFSTMTAAYLALESCHYHSAELLERMERVSDYLLRVQHPDGTIDLYITNFASPPDTGFVVQMLAPAAEVLRARKDPNTRRVQEKLETFVRRAAEGLITGGIHTPNHRWVVAAALSRCHHLFPDPRYLARIDQWLAEGIDLDSEGQFTEHSTGGYNEVSDHALITLGRMLNRPDLFDPARKNLETMLYFLHPNDEIATDISHRQDRFQPIAILSYYRCYRFMAYHDRNGRFASVANYIERNHLPVMGGYLIDFMETPALRQNLPPREPIPIDYEKYYPLSSFVHIRRGERSASILGDDDRFFSFRNGGAVVEAVRMASAYFGKGQFSGPLRQEGNAYRMEQQLEGFYYQPLPPEDRRPDGNWLLMPQSLRAHSNFSHLQSSVEIRETPDGCELSFDISGTDEVPMAVEITLRPGGKLTGDALTPVTDVPNAYILGEGFATYELAGSRVRIGPGFRRHIWTQMHHAQPRLEGLSVYMTGFTPLKQTIRLAAA